MELRQRWWELLGKALLSLGGNYVRCFCGACEASLKQTYTAWQHLSGQQPFPKSLPGSGA